MVIVRSLRQSLVTIAGLAGFGVAAADSPTGESSWVRYVGLTTGIGAIVMLVLRAIIGWAVNKVIQDWEGLHTDQAKIKQQVADLNLALTQRLETISSKMDRADLLTAAARDSLTEWKGLMQRQLLDQSARIAAIEERLFGSIRQRDRPEGGT